MFSAAHPTTDIAKILRHVRFVPTAEVDVSLNHFVSASPQRWWHRTTESVWPSDAQLCCQFQNTDQRWRFFSTSSARSACTGDVQRRTTDRKPFPLSRLPQRHHDHCPSA